MKSSPSSVPKSLATSSGSATSCHPKAGFRVPIYPWRQQATAGKQPCVIPCCLGLSCRQVARVCLKPLALQPGGARRCHFCCRFRPKDCCFGLWLNCLGEWWWDERESVHRCRAVAQRSNLRSSRTFVTFQIRTKRPTTKNGSQWPGTSGSLDLVCSAPLFDKFCDIFC